MRFYSRLNLPTVTAWQSTTERSNKEFKIAALFIRRSLICRSMETWRGVPLCDIYGSSSPWGAPELPLVAPAYNHAVLYHVSPTGGVVPSSKPYSPQRGQDKWDKDCVRMPCSTHSLYPVREEDGSTNLVKRWDLIKQALLKPIHSSEQLAAAICSYNTKFKSQWRFRALHYLFNEYLEEEESQYFFNVTLPAIASLALALPQLMQSPIPLLRQYKNRSVSLTQEQISSLLANAFFCTFPRRNNSKKTSEYCTYPYINFNSLYESSATPSVMEKLKCICHYFRRVCTKAPVGVVTFSRRTVEPDKCPAWAESARLLGDVPLHVNSSGTIEDDGVGLIQVDFANKYLGGGVLNHGCVQEEIRFVICPELLVSMLFTQALKPTEALVITGIERYSKYTGYGSSFQWAGDYEDTSPYDASGRRRCTVLAIDALPFSQERLQYRPEVINRELNKAWVGFSAYTPALDAAPLHRPGLATGNWGCGAFGGSPALKSLLQLMSAAEARRPLAYYTFGDVQLRNDIVQMYHYLAQNHVTVGQLYKYLMKFSRSGLSSSELYPFIQQIQQDSRRPSLQEPQSELPQNQQTDGPSKSVTDFYKRPISPDIFSSSEYSSQTEPFVDLEKGEENTKSHMSKANVKLFAKEKDQDLVYSKVVDKSENNEKSPRRQQSSLFEDMTKFDDENSKISFSKSAFSRPSKSQSFIGANVFENSSENLQVNESEQNNLKINSVEQHEDLSKSEVKLNSIIENEMVQNTDLAKNNQMVEKMDTSVCDSAQHDDTVNTADNVEKPVEGKKAEVKKITRKITDYFNKKF